MKYLLLIFMVALVGCTTNPAKRAKHQTTNPSLVCHTHAGVDQACAAQVNATLLHGQKRSQLETQILLDRLKKD